MLETAEWLLRLIVLTTAAKLMLLLVMVVAADVVADLAIDQQLQFTWDCP